MKPTLITSRHADWSAGYPSLGTRAGPYLFLAGQVPIDPASGEVVTRLEQLPDRGQGLRRGGLFGNLWDDVIRGPVAAQAWHLLDSVRAVLEEQGGSLADVAKVNVYLTDLSALSAFELAWDHFFPTSPPARTVFGVHNQGMRKDVRVSLDAIALLPEPGGPTRQAITSDRIPGPLGRYAHAVRTGPLLFVSGLAGLSSRTGRPVERLDEFGEAAQPFRETLPIRGRREEALMAQMWAINQQLATLLEEQGSSAGNLLIQNILVRDMRRDFTHVLPVNKQFYPQDPPACTGFAYQDVWPDPDVLVQVEAVAVVPETAGQVASRRPLNFHPDLTQPTTHYTMATAAGPFLFLSGRAGINWQRAGLPANRFADVVDWGGHRVALGRLDDERPAMAQAWYALKAIERIIATQGATMDDVARLVVYIQDLADVPTVEAMTHLFFEGPPPATTVVPISQATMYEDLVVEIEPIVVLPEAGG